MSRSYVTDEAFQRFLVVGVLFKHVKCVTKIDTKINFDKLMVTWRPMNWVVISSELDGSRSAFFFLNTKKIARLDWLASLLFLGMLVEPQCQQ